MTRHKHIASAVLLTSILLAGGIARAEPASGPAPSGSEQVQPGCRHKGDRAQRMEENLAALRSALQLSAAQVPVWEEWSSKLKETRPGGKGPGKTAESWSNLSAVERMEKKLAHAKERQGKLEERIAATKVFYNDLSPEQRQTFDKQFKSWPRARDKNAQ